MSCSKNVDITPTPAAAGNPQELKIGGKGQVVRKPFPSVTQAVENPYLPSLLSGGREHIQNKGGPTTDAGGGQPTDTANPPAVAGVGIINDADSGVHNDLSGSNIQALHDGLAHQGHKVPATSISPAGMSEAGTSEASMDTLHYETDKSPYGPANVPFVDIEVAHMATWA